MTVLSIGELLWDVFPDQSHLGGAPFNFAASCARLGHNVLFLSAVSHDDWGDRALAGVKAAAVSAEFVQRTDQSATGMVHVKFDQHGQPDYTLQRPAAYDFLRLDNAVMEKLAGCSPSLIYFGTLSQIYDNNRAVVKTIAGAFPKAIKFYDVNLRRDSFSSELLQHLLPLADLVKFNEEETTTIQNLLQTRARTLEQFCRSYAERFQWKGVCVTRGAAGCSLWLDGEFLESPGFPVRADHPVGAGDAFSAAFCHGIGKGWQATQIAEFANRVGAVVASQPEAVSDWTVEDCLALTRPDKLLANCRMNQ